MAPEKEQLLVALLQDYELPFHEGVTVIFATENEIIVSLEIFI